MNELRIRNQCGRCNGTGIDDNKKDVEGNLVSESCTSCGGDGWMEGGKIDITEIMDQLDYIHGKVTAIWNKVKEKE